MGKRLLVLSIILVLLLSVLGCSSEETVNPETNNDKMNEQPENEQNENNQNENSSEQDDNQQEEQLDEQSNQQDQETTQEKEPKIIAPLTGLPIKKELTRRIYGVMIENQRLARPQTGLDQADMVYEILTEGMITRFVALYQSHEPEMLGPIRSIRPYFIDIINGFDAILVHTGASPAAYTTILNNPLPDLDGIKIAGEAYWREDFREEPHNLYTSTERIKKAANRRGYNSEGYIPTFIFYDEKEEIKGDAAKELTIAYYADYKVNYKYDSKTKLYQRYINAEPHIDLKTKNQLTARNVLVIRADHKIIDNIGRREIDVYGPGKGYLFQNGVAREVSWKREDGVIRTYIDGKEQGLYPGQTWIIVVPSLSYVSYQ